MSVWELHEQSGVPIEVLDELMAGEYNMQDSDPITRVEAALRWPLRHL